MFKPSKETWLRGFCNSLCGYVTSKAKPKEQIKSYENSSIYALLIGDEGPSYRYLGFVHKDLELMEDVLKRKLNFVVSNPCLIRDNTSGRVRPLTRAILYDEYINGPPREEQDQYSCFLFYYSGHGDSSGILLSSDQLARVEYDEIVQTFRGTCINKPRIFIFDCCRSNSSCSKKEPMAIFCNRDIPRDVVVVFACVSEEDCYGDKNGSHFTRHLADKLATLYHDMSFNDIIAQASWVNDYNRPCPILVSTLTQQLYFRVCRKFFFVGQCVGT